MWPRKFDPVEMAAENAVLEAVATVVVRHLRVAARERVNDADPVLIQVDGPGRTQFLNKLQQKLAPPPSNGTGGHAGAVAQAGPSARIGPSEDGWIPIWFDAWRYQRVAPPWWWLMSELDKQLRARCWQIGKATWARQRSRDIVERLSRLARDLLWVLPGAALLLIGWLLWDERMFAVLKWLITAAGGIAALVALVSSLTNALRRHLLAQSPRGATALLRSSDPMADLLRRYAFLVHSGGRPIVVLIDNLDRCRAEYVVEMLEGIQTLLRHPPPRRRRGLRSSRPPQASPFVAFVVAADREWLCDSYLHVYKEFENCAHEPGRPFGLIFVDKIFDVGLRIPTVPAAAAQRERTTASAQAAAGAFAHCTDELAVRRQLGSLERSGVAVNTAPDPRLRREAVMRLADLELKDDGSRRRQCLDTARHLDELLAHLDPGPAVQRQLDVAYCVKRTTQLLAGHETDDDADAIYRLGLWTMLELRWPFLGEHLSRHPADITHLARGTVPEGIGDDLAVVFTHPAARRLVGGFRVHLSAADVERFTTPLRDKPETADADRDAPLAARAR